MLPDAKAAVGRAAAALVEPGQTIVLDAGSTPLAMARALTVRPLTVITSSLDVAAIFAEDPQVQIALTGGTWQPANRALWGPAAIAMLQQCAAPDWAVPGACAIDARLGVSAPVEAVAALKRAMIACARRTLILGDHSKLAGVAAFHVADWSQVDTLLIDEPWPEGEAAGVRDASRVERRRDAGLGPRPASHRPIALQRDAQHHPPMPVVVVDRVVLHAAVVPEGDRSGFCQAKPGR